MVVVLGSTQKSVVIGVLGVGVQRFTDNQVRGVSGTR
jgi:hypothetical protein